MESPLLSILLPPILSSLFLILLIKRFTLHKISNPTNFPPGPSKLPIIGNLHQLLGEHPHRRLQNLAKTYGPLLHLKLGEINLIVITSRESVRDIFTTHDRKFASRPKLMAGKIIFYNNTNIGLAPYSKTWSKLRKICIVELLSLKRVTSFKFIREEEGNNLVEKIRMAGRSPVNLSAMLLSLSNVTIARAAFGKGSAQQQRFLLAMKKTFEYLSRFNVVDLFPSWSFLGEISGLRHGMEQVHMEMDGVLNEIIKEHEGKKLDGDDTNEDLVDVLLRIKRSGELDLSLTMENIKAIILDLFLAGSDPSSTTLVWAMTELIRYPKVMQKAQLEVRKALNGKVRIEEGDIHKLLYINQVIKETLRLHPPTPLLVPRLCCETVELSGYTVPVESRVVINVWAMMRDPNYWEDPEIFQPERFEEKAIDFGVANFEFTPFGGGRRICPGISFALASMELWLAQLLFYFDWELPGGRSPQKLDVEEAFDLTLTRKNDLCLVATYHE
ncbi:premnaspirodiene oxygenase-like [Dendrobium catenatum]|uniref:premnaspirodiene oxygenase-like n=1 Tax=Dendrobium catenatum TaxID=906689 RepID=UPI0010A07877|nr:premnaspirodiene oxygenase-like [Dendrobium catenatum]